MSTVSTTASTFDKNKLTKHKYLTTFNMWSIVSRAPQKNFQNHCAFTFTTHALGSASSLLHVIFPNLFYFQFNVSR